MSNKPFYYQDPFPLKKDETEYYLLSNDYVSVAEFEGQEVLKVAPQALTLLAKHAFHDASFMLRTLQQEAARKLGYSVSQTMMIAQRLYESGLITYMRTDSVNLSDLALGTAKEAILDTYGEKYYKFRQYHTKSKGAQEAHEAIRPTYISNDEISGTAQEKRLYELIRKRTIACQMADAELERTTISVGIGGKKEKFVATGEVITFDGFLQVYRESFDDENEKEQENGLLPPVTLNEVLCLVGVVRFG